MRRWPCVALAVASCLPVVAARGQDATAPVSIRLRVAEEARVGKPAPDIVLQYATRDGPGPVDQPFSLRKELGNVVVLAFYPGDFTPGCTAEWQALRDRAAELFGRDVVVVGISTDSLASHVRFAREFDLPFKFLSDPDLIIARQYDAADGRRARRAVVVLGRDGVVRYIDRAFAALDPESYVHLGAAVTAASKE
ncbi:MAG TPA: redoxin domain-containing protein [Gemmatimonadales bacterium]|nr:redoxin domain-containing protein [Gemmatimonadales bacterium]